MTCRQHNQAIAYSALEISRQIGLNLEPAQQNSVQPVAFSFQAILESLVTELTRQL